MATGQAALVQAAQKRHRRTRPALPLRNCRHENEPGCAVPDALDAERIRSFAKIKREVGRDRLADMATRQAALLQVLLVVVFGRPKFRRRNDLRHNRTLVRLLNDGY